MAVYLVTGNHPFYTLRGNDFCRCGCGNSLWVESDEYIKLRWSPEYTLRKNYLVGHYKKNIGNHLIDESNGIFKLCDLISLNVSRRTSCEYL